MTGWNFNAEENLEFGTGHVRDAGSALVAKLNLVGVSREELVRRAHLIAAAPDMAEALAQAGSFIADLHTADLDDTAADGGVTVGMVFQKDAKRILQTIRAALAKARGEST